MPSGFRLNFTPNRPSPSPRSTLASQQTERSNSSSSTDFEKVGSPTTTSSLSEENESEPEPLKPPTLATDHTMPPVDKPVKIPRIGLTEEEKEFATEERQQWAGELQRMESFAMFLDSIKSTFSKNNDEQCQKFQALLDEQEADHLSRDGRRQGLFDKAVAGFSAIAKENQSKWEANASFYESTREALMKNGRQRRTKAKDAAEEKLFERADEIQKEEQEAFEEEVQRMDAVVSSLVDRAKQATERLLLETAKAEDNSPPGEVNQESTSSDEESTSSDEAIPTTRFDAEIQPCCLGPAVVPRPISPPSRSPSRSPRRTLPTIIHGPIHGPICRLSRSPRPSRSRSPRRCTFDDGELQEEPVQGPTPVPYPANSQSHAEDQVILSLVHQRQLEWEKDEEARDEGEEKRQELFDSALASMHADHSSSLKGLETVSFRYEARRGNAETTRDQEFEDLLRTVRAGFDLFKTGVEKKFTVLNALEDEYDEQLKSDIRATSEREGRELVRGRKRLSTKFEKLQAERRARLTKAFDELRKAKSELKNMNTGDEHGRVPMEESSDVYPGWDRPAMPLYQPPMPRVPPVVMCRARSSSRSGRSMDRYARDRRAYSPQGRPYFSRSPRRRQRRSRSPAMGFTPQTLFKMQNVSTLPIPRPLVQTSGPDNDSLIPSAQPSERARILAESLSKRGFIFAINETKRQVAFEQAQIERQNTFSSAEFERASTSQKKLQEQIWTFLEAEDQRETTFIGKSRSRSERFVEEQKKMGREYIEMEERLARECSRKERQRAEGMRIWMDRFVEEKQNQWEEEVERETWVRNGRFSEMAMDS